jgi:hypothetical protein
MNGIIMQNHMVGQFMNSIFKILHQHFSGTRGNHKKRQPHQAKTQTTLKPGISCIKAYRITTIPTCAAKNSQDDNFLHT